MDEVEIGYLCSRGHYCFFADPDEHGECGSKSMGKLVFVPISGLGAAEGWEAIDEASQHLGDVFETWRNSDD